MPLPFFMSTTGAFAYGGGAFTRLKGLILSGVLGTTGTGNVIEGKGGIALIQPGLICSTLGPSNQILSTASASVSAGSYMYIPQTTGPIFTSTFALADAAPPFTGMGAALVWDSANKRLNVFSTVHGWVSQLSSVGGGYFSSS